MLRKAKLHTVLGAFLQVMLEDDSHSTLIVILAYMGGHSISKWRICDVSKHAMLLD